MSHHPLIPEQLRDAAARVGVNACDVNDLWSRHCELVDKDGGSYGGVRWVGLAKKHVQDAASVPIVPRTEVDPGVLRKREQEAKALEDEAYLRTAVSLGEWIGDLQAADDCYEALSEAERRLVAFRRPQPGEDPIAWLFAALGRDEAAPLAARIKPGRGARERDAGNWPTR